MCKLLLTVSLGVKISMLDKSGAVPAASLGAPNIVNLTSCILYSPPRLW